MVSAAGGTQEQLAHAAGKSVQTITNEAEYIKLGAKSLGADDIEAQVGWLVSSSVYKYIKEQYVCAYKYIRYVCAYKYIRYVCACKYIRYVCAYKYIRYVCMCVLRINCFCDKWVT